MGWVPCHRGGGEGLGTSVNLSWRWHEWQAEGLWGSCPWSTGRACWSRWSGYAGHCWPHRPAHLPPPLWVGGLLIVLFGSLGTRNFSGLNTKLVNCEFLHARKILRMAELREGWTCSLPQVRLYGLFPQITENSVVFFSLCPSPLSVETVPGGSVVKNPPAIAGDVGSIPELERSPGEGNGNPL